MTTGAPLSPETLAYAIAAPSDPQISPDGTRVAYTLNTVDRATRRRRSQVWLCTIDGGQPEPLTDPEQSAGGARWSPDGTSLAVTRQGAAIWVLPSDSDGEPRQITSHDFGVDDLAWSPDGTRIAYTCDFDPDDPDERGEQPGPPKVRVTRRIDYKQDGRGYLGDRRTHVFVVDVASGTRRRLTTELVDHSSPQWSPDGRHLAMSMARPAEQGAQLVVVDVESGDCHPVTAVEGLIEGWGWSPDGAHLAYTSDPGHTFQHDFFCSEVATGVTRRLTDDLGAELEGHPVWVDDSHVVFHSIREGASGLELLDTETGSTELLEQSACRGSDISVDGTARFVAQARTTLTSTGEIVVFDRQTGDVRTVTDYGTVVLADHPPAGWEKRSVQNEGYTIDAWLLKPPDFDPSLRYPVILDIHGGPSSSHGPRFIAHQQCWATNGFLVISPNPRGSTSYGRDFARQVIRDWGEGDYRDLMAVLDAVLEEPYADSARTGIFGISYGGYLCSWTISQTNRFAAAICGEPIFDLESDYGTSDVAYNGLEHHGGGPPHAERAWYDAHSPSTFAHQTRTPTLIFHGEADGRCPIGQSEQMFTILKKAGCEAEFVRYPEGSHMFFLMGPPEHRADWLARTLGWFTDHLGGPEPAATEG
ncbi:MAG: S9 family peptidase [Actinomycetota bacterium]|nr:S9 family peptidase [Actinomycetota bacterium]